MKHSLRALPGSQALSGSLNVTGFAAGYTSAALAALAVLSVLSACSEPVADHTARFHVFGTQVEVTLREVGEPLAAEAFARLGRDFQRMHREWHPWEHGALTEANRALVSGGWVNLTPDLARLLEASQAMERASGGRFNAAIGALVALWGFHTSDYPLTTPPPDAQAVTALAALRPSTLAIELDGQRMRSTHPGIQLDFSGIAKGLAVQRACQQLARLHIHDAMINAGGDVLICGPTQRPWVIGIRDPAGGVLTTVEIRQPMAIFTSGNYHRYGESDGVRYAHILNPFTGHPVAEVMQATVIHPDPLLADAAATALIVAGSAHWEWIAEAMGAGQVLVVEADGSVHRRDTTE